MARWQLILGALGTTVALLLVLSLVDWSALVHAWRDLSLAVILGAAAASIIATLLQAYRWVVLVAGATAGDRRKAFRHALVGQSFNAVTPAAVGGDAYRVAVARDLPGGRARATGLVVLERLVGVAAFAMIYLIAYASMAAEGAPPAVFSAAAVAFLAPAAFPLLILAVMRMRLELAVERLLPQRLSWVAGAVAAVSTVTPARLLAVLGLSIAGAVSWIFCVGILAYGAGLALAPGALTGAVIVAEFARLLPISIQGIGVREATFAWLATEAGAAAAPAVVACATAYALHFFLVTVIALMERTALAPHTAGIGKPMVEKREREDGI